MQSINWKNNNWHYGRCFIIAELSANHGGNLDIALETVRAAKRAGADAIKLQTYTPDTITIDSNRDDFVLKSGSIWDGKTFYELYKEAYTPWEWHETIFNLAKKEGLVCFSSPFDKSAVDFLEELNTPIYKIASFEITDIPLIEYVASKGKPIIISTGIATPKDIELALKTCIKAGNQQIALLKCTSGYPTPLEEANLIMIKELAEKYKVITGLSDHTLGIVAPVVAIGYGAKIIEKHFILSKDIGGPDASFSLDEKEFKQMADAVRQAEQAVGSIDYELTPKQIKSRDFSRSLYVVEDIKKGELFTEANIKSIRPGFGAHPKHLPEILNTEADKDWKKGDRFTFR